MQNLLRLKKEYDHTSDSDTQKRQGKLYQRVRAYPSDNQTKYQESDKYDEAYDI